MGTIRTKRLTYKWSEKHKDYIRRAEHCAINIAEGSIRSGKTTDNVFCFAHDLKRSKDKLHLATASTQPTAKVIIGDCDGYGLEHIFKGQCRWGKYKGNECLKICGRDTGYNEKIVLFCGGAKADSYKKFRGMSIGLWIATEINLHHPDTIREAQRRQINADIKRFYWDLNPDTPTAYIYKDFIDIYKKKSEAGQLKGGFNLATFNIFDNVNLSKDNLDAEISKYEVGTVWYRRDILGERCTADGIIFPEFANDPTRWTIPLSDVVKTNDAGDKIYPKFRYCECGFDIGGNGSAYAMTCTGQGYDGIQYKLKAQKKQAGEMTMDDIERFVVGFCEECEKTYGVDIDMINCDHVAVVVNTINDNTKYRACLTQKPPLEDRVFLYSKLFARDRVKFVKGMCDDLIDEMRNLVFDDKSDRAIPKDDGSQQIDTWDSNVYSESAYFQYIEA